jgi:hypothetical protein
MVIFFLKQPFENNSFLYMEDFFVHPLFGAPYDAAA